MRYVDLWDFCVWAYQRQRVVEETGRELLDLEAAAAGERVWGSVSSDGCHRVGVIARLGARIDGGGAFRGVVTCHPDAERLHNVVLSLPPSAARHVIAVARTGIRPEPCTAQPVLRPVRNASAAGGARYTVDGVWSVVPRPKLTGREDKTVLDRCEVVRKAGFLYEVFDDYARIFNPYCPVEQVPPQSYVDSVKADYTKWHRAMIGLLGLLRCDTVAFKNHVITGFR